MGNGATARKPTSTSSFLRPANQPRQRLPVGGISGLTKMPDHPQSACESSAGFCRLADPREHRGKVVLEKMLQQACRDSGADIGLRVLAPAQGELPYVVRIRLDEITHTNNRLPSRIDFPVWRRPTGKEPLRAEYRLPHPASVHLLIVPDGPSAGDQRHACRIRGSGRSWRGGRTRNGGIFLRGDGWSAGPRG